MGLESEKLITNGEGLAYCKPNLIRFNWQIVYDKARRVTDS